MKKVEDRFWDKVDKTKDCWEWIANLSWNGYGIFSPHKNINKRKQRGTI